MLVFQFACGDLYMIVLVLSITAFTFIFVGFLLNILARQVTVSEAVKGVVYRLCLCSLNKRENNIVCINPMDGC